MNRWLWAALFASAGASAAPLGMEQFRAWDYNQDGVVDAAEARSSVDLSGRFNEIDGNLDGRITTQEMEAWLAKPPSAREAWPPQPIRWQLQYEAVQEKRAEREAERAQRILEGGDETPVQGPASTIGVDDVVIGPPAAR
jgi:Ca2+-binding EF-hand superfamily protein